MRWWDVPAAGPVLDVDNATAVDLVEGALGASVDAALVADVPVGAYLSGGVDSSLIVALMAQGRHGPPSRSQGRSGPPSRSQGRSGPGIDTFSAGFGDARFDELPHARRVSALFGTRHHEVVVTPADFEALWPALTWHRDAPLSQPADVALYRLATTARERVTVVLSGAGSDELVGGYPKHRMARWSRAAGVVPPRFRSPLAGTVERRLPPAADRLRTAVRALGAATEEDRAEAWFAPFTAEERRRLVGPAAVGAGGALWPRPGGDPLRRMLYADCHAWLADNLLERGDRMSMAASLELRPPFLDHRLVELAFSLPSRMKVRGGRGKWVVKEVARRHLPAEIVDRPKVGFRVPLDAWFRGDLRTMARDLLDPATSFAGQVFDQGAVRDLLDRHERGLGNEERRIWTLLSLEVWHRQAFAAGPERPPERATTAVTTAARA